jgi:hypothetical protein
MTLLAQWRSGLTRMTRNHVLSGAPVRIRLVSNFFFLVECTTDSDYQLDGLSVDNQWRVQPVLQSLLCCSHCCVEYQQRTVFLLFLGQLAQDMADSWVFSSEKAVEILLSIRSSTRFQCAAIAMERQLCSKLSQQYKLSMMTLFVVPANTGYPHRN